VERAARPTRGIDSNQHPAQETETEYLLCARPASALTARHMPEADRRHWGVETSPHLRLDASAGEDRSRARHRASALNRAMIGRAVVSLAGRRIGKCRSQGRATLSGFFDFMSAQPSKKAFSPVTVSKSSWFPPL
jgi:hypothetical protein